MKRVNLLPAWYFEARRARRILHIRLCLLVLLGAGMLGWTSLARQRLTELKAQRDTLAAEARLVPDLTTQLQQRRTEVQRLENLQLAYRDLGNTVPMSAVIQQLQNNLTAGMAVSRVSLDVRSEPVKGTGVVGDVRNPPHYHDVAYLNVVGIAPNDVLIAQLIHRLAANPLFSNVTLNYTRTEVLSDYNVRRFDILLQMELDRLSLEQPQQARTEEAPDAG